MTRELFIQKAVKRITSSRNRIRSASTRLAHRFCLPNLAIADKRILSDIKTEGVHITTLQDLFGDNALLYMELFDRAIEDCCQCDAPLHKVHRIGDVLSCCDFESGELYRRFPELFMLGLEKRFLGVIENYLGVPIAYHGVAMRRACTDGSQTLTRLWHRDGEDFRVIRVIVYMRHVDLSAGPFEYVPREAKLNYRQFRGLDGRIDDEAMSRVIPASKWKRCIGPAGTVVIADPAAIFHHGMIQKDTERFTLMYGYSSRCPTNRELAKRHFPAEALRQKLWPALNVQQRECTFAWRT